MKPVLLISASDSSGAAGMAVDIRVADDLGQAVRCVLTAVTVQGEGRLINSFPVDPQNVAEAIEAASMDPAGVSAVKIGLITTPEVAQTISTSLAALDMAGIPLILDPVMRSTPGSILASRNVKEALVRDLLPLATVVTPNRDELDEMTLIAGDRVKREEDKARSLTSMGAKAVLVTGGDGAGSTCVDILYREGMEMDVFEHPKLGTGSTRGTGCCLSTALAVHLGRGLDPAAAVGASIEYVTGKIGKADMVGNQRLLFPGKQK